MRSVRIPGTVASSARPVKSGDTLPGMATEAWLAEHKGPLRDVIGKVWYCGDDYCDCTQAEIVERYENKTAPGWIVPVCIWQGEFHTDGEPGANEELAAKREELRKTDPDLAARIKWLGLD